MMEFPFLACLLLALFPSMLGREKHWEVCYPETALQRAKQLSPEGQHRFIKQLKQDGDRVGLCAIARSSLEGSAQAAMEVCALLETDEALAFCTTLDIRTHAWRCACYELRTRPKHKVIGYLKQIASSSVPEARWVSYQICRYRRWDDLVEQAKADAKNRIPVCIPRSFDSTISDAAERYLDALRMPPLAGPPIP